MSLGRLPLNVHQHNHAWTLGKDRTGAQESVPWPREQNRTTVHLGAEPASPPAMFLFPDGMLRPREVCDSPGHTVSSQDSQPRGQITGQTGLAGMDRGGGAHCELVLWGLVGALPCAGSKRWTATAPPHASVSHLQNGVTALPHRRG